LRDLAVDNTEESRVDIAEVTKETRIDNRTKSKDGEDRDTRTRHTGAGCRLQRGRPSAYR